MPQVHWAERMQFDTGLNPLASALAEARASGRKLHDLTVSNPTRCGFRYDAEALLKPFADTQALTYEAHPLGAPDARAAIAEQYYAPRRVEISPDRLLLTTSTSEAYGYLFRLLCNPGDEVLLPQPSYPLFDMLSRMNDVVPRPYPLLRHDDWRMDFKAMASQLTSRTRALIVVHPNNPTGHFTHAEDRARLDRFAAEHGLALIVDEVFLDYSFGSERPVSFAAEERKALTFVLSGLSKAAALPQMKLAWTCVCGPQDLCKQALDRLEFIADTYLSVQSPVQHAIKPWLALAPEMREQVRERCRENLDLLDQKLRRSTLLQRLPVEGGWSVVLRCPEIDLDEQLAERLLSNGVVVHPGSFYGLPGRGWIVLSTLVSPKTFAAGVAVVVDTVEEYGAGNHIQQHS